MTEATAPDSSQLLENQVNELYRNSNIASLTIFAIASLLAWILTPVADADALTLWLGYTLVITLARFALAFYHRTAKHRLSSQQWVQLYAASVFLSGLGWGSVIVFVVPVEATFHLVSAIFVIGGLVTASAGSMASLKHGFAIYSIPALMPGAVKLLLLNQNNTVLIGLFICAFLIFIALIAMRIHETILHSLKTQFESAKFVVEVQEIHEALISRYDELERQLELSTKKILELQAELEQKGSEIVTVAEQADRRVKGDRFHYLLDKLHGGSWNYNLKTGEIRFSQQWLNMLGYKENEVYTGLDFWSSLLHPDEKMEVLEKLQAHINGKVPQYFSSHRLKSRSGDWKWVFSRGQPVVWGKFGEALDIVFVEIDIEDPETYLAGKLSSGNFKASEWLHSEAMFTQRLQYALRTTTLENVEHALCHICVYPTDLPADLNFEPGKELSKQLASILIRECRHEDPVLDLGNNSFAVLLENLSIDTALNKAASLQNTIDAHQFVAGGQKYGVSAAIGITPIYDMHRTVQELLDDAQEACNIASTDTPDNIFVYQRGNVVDADTFEKRMLTKIRDQIAGRKLLLNAAPLKAPGTTAGVPAVSWLSAALPGPKNYAYAVKELLDPKGNNSLATAFDLCVLEMFRDWTRGQPKGFAEPQHVYIFDCRPASILDEDFISQAIQLYAEESAAKQCLCIAFTEALFATHNEQVRACVDALKPLGIKFALTEFGAASFSHDYMKNLPVDFLVLHDSLVAGIGTDKSSVLTIKFLNEIGHVLNMKTIAPCSDNELQGAALAKIGTDYLRLATPENHSLGDSPLWSTGANR